MICADPLRRTEVRHFKKFTTDQRLAYIRPRLVELKRLIDVTNKDIDGIIITLPPGFDIVFEHVTANSIGILVA
ncbi:MAG: hypothetical protein DI607_03305 [Sphingomonas hengshuiensis]|nr:MAG: hypothetical protein DI607_03305 [Sphingomonas hengshuiensis]